MLNCDMSNAINR